ncbi:complement component C9-like [Dendropsophus ebraccatus]|uniref:complement component C9-like n=1 Tax=Dendropsophus ebraccatus TaxID=150705 RepID=UPI0038321643
MTATAQAHQTSRVALLTVTTGVSSSYRRAGHSDVTRHVTRLPSSDWLSACAMDVRRGATQLRSRDVSRKKKCSSGLRLRRRGCRATWSLRRSLRSAEAPPPIDCEISKWSDWSECDPCTKQRYRSRSIVRFGQYGGARCLSPLGEYQRCKTDQTCGDTVIDCGNDFQCETGRCIKNRLLCNVDNDCGDSSDETCDDDQEPKPVCRNMDVDLSELSRTAGDGFNILGMEIKRNPFDNEYFNGICERVRDGNTRTYYRKSWNVAALVYQTKADKSFTTETYEDAVDLLTKILREQTQETEISLSIKVTPSEYNGTSITGSFGPKTSRNESIQTIKEYSIKKNKQFLRVTGSVQLGTFQMRTRGQVLSTTFIEDLNNLPSSYQKGEYFAFLEMYGTHYPESGVVGGKYELVYVLDSTTMKSKEITTTSVAQCLGYNAGISVQENGVDVSTKLTQSDCEKILRNTQGGAQSSLVIEKVVSFVEGGTIQFATLLEEKLSRRSTDIDVQHFVNWASSLVDAPGIIKRKLAPIYILVPDNLRDAYTKKKNLERALEDYRDEYSVCKCQPCQNGGTLVLLDGECMCKCSLEYTGLACETKKHELLNSAPKNIDGRWSCWKPSSTCVNGEEIRTRTCNNPAPQPGGKPCPGESKKAVPCQISHT